MLEQPDYAKQQHTFAIWSAISCPVLIASPGLWQLATTSLPRRPAFWEHLRRVSNCQYCQTRRKGRDRRNCIERSEPETFTFSIVEAQLWKRKVLGSQIEINLPGTFSDTEH